MKLPWITPLALALLTAGCGASTIAASGQGPAARAGASSASDTALQRHVRYFDQDGNGLIQFSETVKGVEALGVGAAQGRILATGLHAVLGPKTSGKLSTEIRIANIQRGVHPGSINFDRDGNFKPESFRAMFADYDTNRSGALSRSEVFAMLKARKKSAVSYNLSKTAFTVLLAVASDVEDAKEPALSRNRMQAFYDGSLFYTIAKERRGRPAPAVELKDAELNAPPEAMRAPAR